MRNSKLTIGDTDNPCILNVNYLQKGYFDFKTLYMADKCHLDILYESPSNVLLGLLYAIAIFRI